MFKVSIAHSSEEIMVKMTKGRKLFVGSGSRLLALGVNIIVGFLLMPFIIHSLGDRIFGYWSLAATVIGYYGLLDLGIVQAIQYYTAKAIGKKDAKLANEVISSSFFFLNLVAGVIVAISIILACMAEAIIKNSAEADIFRIVIFVMGFSFGLSFPGRTFLGVVSANLRFDLISLINIVMSVLRAVAIVLFLNAGYGIIGLSVIVACEELIKNVFLYLIAKRIHYKFRLSISLLKSNTLKRLFSYGILIFAIKVGRQLQFYLQPLIVAAFVSVEAITHYSIALRLTHYFLTVIISSFGILAPFFSQLKGEQDYSAIKEGFVLSTKISALTSTFIVCICILYGKAFIARWVGDQYLDAYFPLVILVIGLHFDAFQFPSRSYLIGISKHRFLGVLTGIEVIVGGILGIVMVRSYGLPGLAAGIMVPSMITKLFLQPVYVCRSIDIPLKSYYIKILTIGVLTMVVSVILPWMLIFQYYMKGSYLSIAALIVCQAWISIPLGFLVVFGKPEKRKILAMFSTRLHKVEA